jgi:hypothetical protein
LQEFRDGLPGTGTTQNYGLSSPTPVVLNTISILRSDPPLEEILAFGNLFLNTLIMALFSRKTVAQKLL